ncbi:hypothetical protein JCM33374_g246 [Metschnikowia sp. JCM 33374]|nr:hypothetical protein JCM33374_g246 [Metschnikowia sp. JCM 33374]
MSKSDNTSREATKSKSSAPKKGSVNAAAEEFIHNASDLLEAFPSASVSIAYTAKEGQENTGVKFTVSHSSQSKYLTYVSHDAKEVSRILAFIGPGGITADSISSHKKKHEKNVIKEVDPSEEAQRKPARITGLTSIMSNYDFHCS